MEGEIENIELLTKSLFVTLQQDEEAHVNELHQLLETSLPEYQGQIEQLQTGMKQWEQFLNEIEQLRNSINTLQNEVAQPLRTIQEIEAKEKSLRQLDRLLLSVQHEHQRIRDLDHAEQNGQFIEAAQLILNIGQSFQQLDLTIS